MSNLNQSARFGDKSMPQKISNELYDVYDFASFTVANGVSDYNVRENQSELFKNVGSAWLMILEFNKDISIRFNSATMPIMSLGYETSPREYRDILKMTNLFITNNSGALATIKVTLV